MGLQFTIYGWKRCHQLDSLTWEIRTLKKSYHFTNPLKLLQEKVEKVLCFILIIQDCEDLSIQSAKLAISEANLHTTLGAVYSGGVSNGAVAGHWRLWGGNLHPPPWPVCGLFLAMMRLLVDGGGNQFKCEEKDKLNIGSLSNDFPLSIAIKGQITKGQSWEVAPVIPK